MKPLLSDRKYIETKARNLPLYQCLVNKDWEEGMMADVVVMRRHSNGNITTGIYLVDLLCLGVKDTFFFFNEFENEALERFSTLDAFKEIDYNTAHNIVYAGHDFAMEFGIEPHKDFAVTKHILEEDNDNIPLLDIPVGAKDGKPHLLVQHAGVYSDALAKLKKNAGEGNYYYTVGDDEDDVDDEEDDNEGFSKFLNDYEDGEITPLTAQYVRVDDLEPAAVDMRNDLEKYALRLEFLLRILRMQHPEYFNGGDVEDRNEYQLIDDAELDAEGTTTEMFAESTIALRKAAEYFLELESPANSEEKTDEYILQQLKKYSSNPLIIGSFYETVVAMNRMGVIEVAKAMMEDLSEEVPYARLNLRLGRIVQNLQNNNTPILLPEGLDAATLYPHKPYWALLELNTLWLGSALICLKNNDLATAIHYYELSAETEIFNWMLVPVQEEFIRRIIKILETE